MSLSIVIALFESVLFFIDRTFIYREKIKHREKTDFYKIVEIIMKEKRTKEKFRFVNFFLLLQKQFFYHKEQRKKYNKKKKLS